MTKQPLVSVLMTAYNRELYIGNAIQSILDNTYTNFELIIVDDCSSDNTVQVVKSFVVKDARIRFYRNEQNLGDYPNRNKAASYAKGKYLKYCDSDEELYPYCLELMVKGMEEFDAAFGVSHVHDDCRLPQLVTPNEAYKRHYFNGHFFHNAPTSTMIRRVEFEKEEGFNNIRHRGDYELWLRLGAKYNTVRLPAFLTWNFSHANQEQNLNTLYKKAITHTISMNALYAECCPLTATEKLRAIKKWRTGFIRQNILGGLLKLKIKEVLFLVKECDIKFIELIESLSKLIDLKNHFRN